MAVAVKGPSVGIPVKLFREAESHPVTVELKSGDVYRGTLEESEDSMSCLLKAVHHTARDGRVVRLEAVYLRGSQIRFVVLPELLKGAPLFQCVAGGGGAAAGQGPPGLVAGGKGALRCLRPTRPARARPTLSREHCPPPFTRALRHPPFPWPLQKGQAVCRGQGQAAAVGSRAGRAGRARRARRRAGQGPRRQERHSRNQCVSAAGAPCCLAGRAWRLPCCPRTPLTRHTSACLATPLLPSLSLLHPPLRSHKIKKDSASSLGTTNTL